MLDIPSITGIVAAIGVLVGVTLAYLEVRTLVKQRQTRTEHYTQRIQLYTKLYTNYF